MARPPKYNAVIHKAIVDSLKVGCSRTTAAELAGIDRATLEVWRGRYVAFSRDVENAIATCKRAASATIRQSIIKGDVQSAFRYLALQERTEWHESQSVNVNHTGEITFQSAVEKVAKAEGLDPAEVLAEAQLIVAGGRE